MSKSWLFQKSSPISAAQSRVEDALSVMEKRRAALADREAVLDARRQKVAEVRAEIAAAEAAAVEAMRAGLPLPDLAALRTKLDQAELGERAAAALRDEAANSLQLAKDSHEDAAAAYTRAVRSDALTRLADALDAAVPIADELVSHGGLDYGISKLAFEIRAAADEYANQPEHVDIGHFAANGADCLTRRVPVDVGLRAVASGKEAFVHSKDERKYAAQVNALREEKSVA